MASQFISFTPHLCRQKADRDGVPTRCCWNQNHGVSQTQLSNPKIAYNNIKIKTLDNCQMNISRYSLLYDGQGGRGTGKLVKVEEDKLNSNAPQGFEFDLSSVHIPPLTSKTAKFFGQFPLPPSFKVDVVPETLKADIYVESGKVEFIYIVKLYFSFGSGYKAPPLLVDMILTTEELKAGLTKGTRGKRLDQYGKCKLVGVARVDRVDDQFINSVIGLPSDCLTSLNLVISFFVYKDEYQKPINY